MGFLGDFFFYYHRITMSVSIVAMVNSSALPSEITEPLSESCLDLITNVTDENNSHEQSSEKVSIATFSPHFISNDSHRTQLLST